MYLKVTIKAFSNFQFSGFKNLSPVRFWRAPTQADIIEF